MSVATFESIQVALSADSKLGTKVGGSLQFVLTGGQGGDSTWVVDCKQAKGRSVWGMRGTLEAPRCLVRCLVRSVRYTAVSRGAGKADCTVTLSEENFLALASGKLQGMQAFVPAI